jgi:hypothetical protein
MDVTPLGDSVLAVRSVPTENFTSEFVYPLVLARLSWLNRPGLEYAAIFHNPHPAVNLSRVMGGVADYANLNS